MRHLRRRFAFGFTLLEVIISMAILAVSLVAVFDINAQAVNSHVYAKKLTVATLLARSKMTDLEQELYDKPLPADDDEDSGDFSDEGWPSFKWRSKIIVPKTNGLSPDQLFGALFGMPMGGGEDDPTGGLLGGLFGGGKTPPGGAQPPGGPNPMLAAMGPMAGMASAQFEQMVQQLQQSVREVHLTVTWKEGTLTESVDLVTHVVSLGPGSDRNGGAAAVAANNNPASPQQGPMVRVDNGQVVPNPVPASNGAGFVDPRDGVPVVPQASWQQPDPAMLQQLRGRQGLPQQLVPQGAGSIIRPTLPKRGGLFQ